MCRSPASCETPARCSRPAFAAPDLRGPRPKPSPYSARLEVDYAQSIFSYGKICQKRKSISVFCNNLRVTSHPPENPRLVFAENPEEEMWRHLSGFTYIPNIERYLIGNNLKYSIDKAEEISTFFLQAQEYFSAAKHSSMQISPLLLYYGTVNLYSALRSIKGLDDIQIADHGMRLDIPNSEKEIGEIKVKLLGRSNGGFSEFAKLFGEEKELNELDVWKLSDILSCIPDIYEDFITSIVYDPKKSHLVPINIDLNSKNESHRIDSNTSNNLSDDFDPVNEIVNYKSAYIMPNILLDGSILLRLRLDSEDISISSLSGRRYLRKYLKNGSKKGFLSSELAYLMSLYLLGVISRYNPSIWNPFASRDITGERRIIERFLLIARRVIPNLIINKLEDENIIFTNSRYQPKNPAPMSMDQLRETVKEIIQKGGR